MPIQNKYQVIRIKELLLITGISRSSIYEKLNPQSERFDPSFPTKIKLGKRAVGWLLQEVEEWVNHIKANSLQKSEAIGSFTTSNNKQTRISK